MQPKESAQRLVERTRRGGSNEYLKFNIGTTSLKQKVPKRVESSHWSLMMSQLLNEWTWMHIPY